MAGAETRTMRIVVELDPRSTPLAGTLFSPPLPPREFVGLVEFLGAAEELVRRVQPGDPGEDAADRS